MSEKTSMTLTFNLNTLPTAHHRAGLAGLIVLIQSMKERISENLIPVIDQIGATSCKITFTPESMQSLFDDLYAAEIIETIQLNQRKTSAGVLIPSKPGEYYLSKKNKKTDKMEEVPAFAYDDVVAQALWLKSFSERRNIWWKTIRGTRNNKAITASWTSRLDGSPSQYAARFWKCLSKSKSKSGLSSTLMLSMEGVTAEGQKIKGLDIDIFLLHFWQVIMLSFESQRINKQDGKSEYCGRIVAIPDVSNLEEFCCDFPNILTAMESDPKKGKIYLTGQASLEVMKQLYDIKKTAMDIVGHHDSQILLGQIEAGQSFGYSVRAVESYQITSTRKNTKLLSFSRVSAQSNLIQDYRDITRNYRNPLFRSAMINALISNTAWTKEILLLFSTYSSEFFFTSAVTTSTFRYMPRFGRDCQKMFHTFRESYHWSLEKMNEEEMLKNLSNVVHRIVNRYVTERCKQDNRNDEERQKLCRGLFFEMRSRNHQDFINFFANSFFSQNQSISRQNQQFLAEILLADSNERQLSWQSVKTIAMMAISACGYILPIKSENLQ